METSYFVADRRALEDASRLIADFGPCAIEEAASRACRSRAVGNAINFCHWRQIERLIPLLASDQATGTIH